MARVGGGGNTTSSSNGPGFMSGMINQSRAPKPKAAPKGPGFMTGMINLSRSAPKAAPKAPTVPRTPTYKAPAPVVPSGKSIGSNSQGHITPIAPPKPQPVVKPVVKPIAKTPAPWTADQDTVYQQQEAAAHTALQDYLSGQTSAQSQYNIEDARNNNNLLDQQKIAQTNMSDDFASRGMSSSGLALKAFGDQANDFLKQQDVLRQAGLNFGTTANSNLNNFNATQNINDTKYRNDAINRHSAGLGLI